MENNHIDQQFNEASKLSEEPTVFAGFEKVWGKIEEKLDHKEEKKRMIPIWFPYGIAASLVIGLGVLYFLNTNDASESVQQSIADISTSKESVVNPNIAQINSIIKENIQKDKNNTNPAVEKIAVQTDPVSATSIDTAMPLPVHVPPIPSAPKIQVAANGYYVQNGKNIEASDRRKDYVQNENANESTQSIDEVVVTAMGVKKSKVSMALASSVVSSNSIAPQTSTINRLQGSVAGIQVGASTNSHVRIRGIASVVPGKDPLYIVNGKIADADNFKTLDPNKIENVAVLKDAAATALYGSKAANGIVLVTTKKLSRREKKRMEKLQEEINKQKQISPVANDESYDTFVENPFELTQSQPLSTFSIDVDNASYSNVRRMINNGEVVNKNAVRVEEMINYFTYDYPQPKNEDPFSINTEYNGAPWNPGHQLLKIGLQGKDIPKDLLPASNLVFLIDVSGSMDEQNKLPLLKSSFKVLLNRLRPKDKVGIVVYAGSAGMVLPSTSAAEKDKIIQALDNLQAGGSTAGGEGIELAYKLARENFVKNGNNRVIIATDGDFNVGESSTSDLQTLIEEKRKSGVFLTCLGFGMGNYKDNTLETLADKGNGNYAYIDNMQEANKFLGREFAGSMYAIAKDVKIQVEFNPEFVKSYRLIGYENRKLKNEDFVNDKIDAGELGSGHTVTALYEIIPVNVQSGFLPKESGLKYTQTISSKKFGDELATIKFRYKKPNGEVSREISQIVKNSDRNISSATPDFKFASSVAWFGLVLRNSGLITKKDLSDIENLAKQGKNKDEEGYRAEFIRLVESYKTIK
ncbi:von Willebrand factor type A domain-containing protein [Chryseobacterium sp. WG14]|uniref:vWA domain-containing protein n=1 Tax=Chryseobacterium sp. WG14 TaxID=2926909 RepID=UPI00211E6771|nr:von Willebrand factor type A domain-containing protein [Chryseobacterium sp. WG14]MCQ9638007.1 von Willebrand factor type A domain-containing protein [Chryseobacterium sp. WG14]